MIAIAICIRSNIKRYCRKGFKDKGSNNDLKVSFVLTTGLMISSLANKPLSKTLIPKKTPNERLMIW